MALLDQALGQGENVLLDSSDLREEEVRHHGNSKHYKFTGQKMTKFEGKFLHLKCRGVFWIENWPLEWTDVTRMSRTRRRVLLM